MQNNPYRLPLIILLCLFAYVVMDSWGYRDDFMGAFAVASLFEIIRFLKA